MARQQQQDENNSGQTRTQLNVGIVASAVITRRLTEHQGPDEERLFDGEERDKTRSKRTLTILTRRSGFLVMWTSFSAKSSEKLTSLPDDCGAEEFKGRGV